MKLFSVSFFLSLVLLPVLFGAVYFVMPTIAQADHIAGHPAPADIEDVGLQNPLRNINTIEGLLVAILNIIMILMVPVIVFFIIYAGFKYVMAQGNASQVEEATRALTYAIIGGVLILGAVAISQIIQNVVAAF
ncbi:MAG: hypothetical protein V4668_04380 [Patescibacteria group bacterium]